MGRPSLTRQLAVWMNGERVGEWRLPGRGPQEFVNDPASLISPQFRPLSLSLSVGLGAPVLRGEVLQHWFANLLPDNNAIRVQRKQRFSLQGISAFELLMAAGPDYAGAVQLPPPRRNSPPASTASRPRPSATHPSAACCWVWWQVADPLPGDAAVGEPDLRLSIAGAQEKTALLWHQYCMPVSTKVLPFRPHRDPFAPGR